MPIAVLGSGIVGTCAAAWLQRDGHRITFIDPLGPLAIRPDDLFGCDAVVVAAGAWSDTLAGPLGVRVPLETQRDLAPFRANRFR